MQQSIKSPHATIADGPGQKDRTRTLYIFLRAAAIAAIAFLFIPTLNPARIMGLINRNLSLFTTGISYSQLTSGFGKALRKGWVEESTMRSLMLYSLTACLGLLVQAGGMCASLGSNRLKRIGTGVTLAGSILGMAGLAGIHTVYSAVSASEKASKLEPLMPGSFQVLLILLAAIAVFCVLALALGQRSHKGDVIAIEPKYQLFLMVLPFLILAFLFGYLPLYGWRYAFFDYKAGDTLSMDKFVGLKWFTYLFTNESTRRDIIQVMKNTLGMSGLGIATSWCSMAFAIFLIEIKNAKFKKFVQIFTTIPNFISWVLIFAVATAIFSTDGFISNMMVSTGVWSTGQNLLVNNNHVWLQMLLWGMWKGLGWGAIVYIAAIGGIDQSLYEAATVDGAGRFAKMWNITLPELMPTYCVLLLMSIANILSNGMEQYLVFENSANSAVIQVLDLYVYKLGIGSGLIPLSTAIGMLKSLVSVILLFVANKISKAIRGENII